MNYFEEAIAIQPDFAEAHAALALVQVQFLFGGPSSPHQVIPKAEAAAREALRLDSTVSRAHWALGQILSLYYWRWEDGAQALQRAAELESGHELSLAVSGSLIRDGRFGEAVAVAERGRKLDPFSVNAQLAVGNARRAAGQYDLAIQELRQAVKMSRGQSRAPFQLGVTFTLMGRVQDAITELSLAQRLGEGHNTRLEGYLGYAYAAAGQAQRRERCSPSSSLTVERSTSRRSEPL